LEASAPLFTGWQIGIRFYGEIAIEGCGIERYAWTVAAGGVAETGGSGGDPAPGRRGGGEDSGYPAGVRAGDGGTRQCGHEGPLRAAARNRGGAVRWRVCLPSARHRLAAPGPGGSEVRGGALRALAQGGDSAPQGRVVFQSGELRPAAVQPESHHGLSVCGRRWDG